MTSEALGSVSQLCVQAQQEMLTEVRWCRGCADLVGHHSQLVASARTTQTSYILHRMCQEKTKDKLRHAKTDINAKTVVWKGNGYKVILDTTLAANQWTAAVQISVKPLPNVTET